MAVVYENTYPSLYVVVTYMLAGGPANFNTVKIDFYEFNTSSHTFTLNSGISQTYGCTSYYYANIDADSRAFFAATWESNGDLHTVVGKESNISGPINMGPEWTLPLTSIAGTYCNDINQPDVALYGRNTIGSNNYVYYAFTRCGALTIQEETFNFDDLLTGISTPPIILSWDDQGDGIMAWASPRIAANQYFSSGQSNHPDVQEFTIVSELHDVDGNTNDIGSIYCVTATNTNGVTGTTTYSVYNLNTNYYTGATTPQAHFFSISSGTNYYTDENLQNGWSNNLEPVVAYDKNNDHVPICWNMIYSESLHASDFPTSSFPAHVYANPDYDENNGSSAPSQQGIVTGSFTGIQYNSLDNTAANSSGNGSSHLAVSCHNTNDMLYAWHSGSNIYWRTITSGTVPRMGSTDKQLLFPNPVSSSNSNIHLNLVTDKQYEVTMFNAVGQLIVEQSGNKNEIENVLSSTCRTANEGIYLLKIMHEGNIIGTTRLIIAN